MRQEMTGQDSRQGKRGKPAVYVLIVSVGLMLTSLTGLMLWQGASSPGGYDGKSRSLALSHGISGNTNSNAASSSTSGDAPGGTLRYSLPAVRNANP